MIAPGERFGRLLVIADLGRQRGWREFSCVCDCGAQRVVTYSALKQGRTRSCGCLAKETTVARNRKALKASGHARDRSPTYSSWIAMISRCYQPSSGNFEKYGGSGVVVCERWRTFAGFLADMGERPDGMSLDRIDNSRGYEPENCRWATGREQSQNRKSTHWITIDGETQCVTEWARRAGVSDVCILHRVRRGVTGKALLRPGHHGKRLAADPLSAPARCGNGSSS